LWTLYFPSKTVGQKVFLLQHFISHDEEKVLHEQIMKVPLHPLIFQGYEAKRKVASFGYDWNFQTRTLSKGNLIPQPFQFIIEKVAKKISIPVEQFGELLLTEYPTASVINWHRDAPPFGVIAGISLLTACTLRFRPYEKTK
jgi:alkylated DNA repair dioxygenase AlkB